ncbi:MAG: NADH:ubiquinone reductase (Na(+)-transporting) subunit F [Candidatus Cloacimonadota bacterium]|nr:MAG: NADH:ubiquinone reductase (Na(+)-transporting) subunit F [Candidatus Cloacimonadota bacterium]PIE80615.1 MAG: NADH:ubiquinone reductase (Na(+)-transporting) subunit F [Candidatus Delongbacteria bacterium]
MSIILISTVVFLVIILILTVAIIFSEKFLVDKGNVKIKINEGSDKDFEVESGQTLLNTLSNQGILLPSACGGGGTCGVCRCQVKEGGGDLLPTEESHITRAEAKDNWRLACQVKVKKDMELEIPEEYFNIKKWECEVISNKNVSTYIKEFVLRLPPGEHMHFKAGGYIQIDLPKYDIKFSDMDIEDEYKDEWNQYKMFDLTVKNNEESVRAYSMANYPAEGDIVMLNVRICPPPWDRAKNQYMNVPPGISSSYVFSRKPGDKVTVSGAYGEFFINEDSESEMCYIGGGAGMAPMRSHIMHLFKTMKTKRKVTFWYGARSVKELFYLDDFKALEEEFENFTFNIALSDATPEDKWEGMTGFIHAALRDNYLLEHEAPEDIEYYLCGPPMMIDAVNKMLFDLGVEKEMIRYDEF